MDLMKTRKLLFKICAGLFVLGIISVVIMAAAAISSPLLFGKTEQSWFGPLIIALMLLLVFCASGGMLFFILYWLMVLAIIALSKNDTNYKVLWLAFVWLFLPIGLAAWELEGKKKLKLDKKYAK